MSDHSSHFLVCSEVSWCLRLSQGVWACTITLFTHCLDDLKKTYLCKTKKRLGYSRFVCCCASSGHSTPLFLYFMHFMKATGCLAVCRNCAGGRTMLQLLTWLKQMLVHPRNGSLPNPHSTPVTCAQLFSTAIQITFIFHQD